MQQRGGKKKSYFGEEYSLVWNKDQVQVAISFTHKHKLSVQAHIDGVHVTFYGTGKHWGFCC